MFHASLFLDTNMIGVRFDDWITFGATCHKVFSSAVNRLEIN